MCQCQCRFIQGMCQLGGFVIFKLQFYLVVLVSFKIGYRVYFQLFLLCGRIDFKVECKCSSEVQVVFVKVQDMVRQFEFVEQFVYVCEYFFQCFVGMVGVFVVYNFYFVKLMYLVQFLYMCIIGIGFVLKVGGVFGQFYWEIIF